MDSSSSNGYTFIEGLDRYVYFHTDSITSKIVYEFKNNKKYVTPKRLEMFSGQVGTQCNLVYYRGDEKQSETLFYQMPFKNAIEYFEESPNEGGYEKSNLEYCIGEYDFEEDGVNELVFCMKGESLVECVVYEYSPPGRFDDVLERKNWIIGGVLDETSYCQDTSVYIEGATLTIPWCHRGFFSSISSVNGQFVKTSS